MSSKLNPSARAAKRTWPALRTPSAGTSGETDRRGYLDLAAGTDGEQEATQRRAYLLPLPEFDSAPESSFEPRREARHSDRADTHSANLPKAPTPGDNKLDQQPRRRSQSTSPLMQTEQFSRHGETTGGSGDQGDDAVPIGRETTAEFDPHAIWRMVLSELALQMPSATYDTWVRDTVVIGYEDGEFIIGMPNAYARDWLENRLRHTIKRTLSSIMRRAVQIQFRVRPRPVHDENSGVGAPLYQVIAEEPDVSSQPDSPNRPEHTPPGALRSVVTTSLSVQPERQDAPSGERTAHDYGDDRFATHLNPYHTFDTFVVGNHNRLAHAAALAIIDAPGQTFNPLFIYGGVGLGKTHLLNAIGNSLRQKGFRMIYCSSEQFTNELISSIRNQSTEQFRAKYRQADVLLIDDIQFIGGKESTQEEFFHTFNHLHAAGKQVVLSSDRPPKALPTLDDRLRSRFEGGLQTDIAQPDFETRVAILQTKANRMGVPVPYDVLMLVAERVDSNIRELEGALNRLSMQARLTNQTLNIALAKSMLENLAPQRLPCPPAGVVRIVAEHFGLRPEDLTGRKRTKEIAYAAPNRHVPHARRKRSLVAGHRRTTRRARPQHRTLWRRTDHGRVGP